MQTIRSDEKGFSLIEVIVTLILVGITAALAGMWIVSVANGYLFVKENASNLQKGQLAMTRLTKEFTAIKSVDAGTTATNATQITYTRNTNVWDTTVTATVSSTGGLLQLNGNTLTDGVSDFKLKYCNDDIATPCPDTNTTWSPTVSRIIEISLTLIGAESTPFTKRIAPRNL